MCEFKVFLDGKSILYDIIYVKVEGEDLIFKDVLGAVEKVSDARIVEVDTSSARLTISRN